MSACSGDEKSFLFLIFLFILFSRQHIGLKKVQRTKNKHASWPLQSKRKKVQKQQGGDVELPCHQSETHSLQFYLRLWKTFFLAFWAETYGGGSRPFADDSRWNDFRRYGPVCYLHHRFTHSSKLSPFNQTVAHPSTARCRQPRETPPLRRRCVSARRRRWRCVLKAKGFNKHERSAAV